MHCQIQVVCLLSPAGKHESAEMERKLKALLSTSDGLAEDIRSQLDEMELRKCHELAARWEWTADASKALLEATILEHDPLVHDQIREAEAAQKQAAEQLRQLYEEAGVGSGYFGDAEGSSCSSARAPGGTHESKKS